MRIIFIYTRIIINHFVYYYDQYNIIKTIKFIRNNLHIGTYQYKTFAQTTEFGFIFLARM